MTMRAFKRFTGCDGVLGLQGLEFDEQARALAPLGFVLGAPLAFGSFLYVVMGGSAGGGWGLLVPILVIDAVLAVALLPFGAALPELPVVDGERPWKRRARKVASAIYGRLFGGDLVALHGVARRSGTFAFAWTAMVMAAAIYARLPIYLIAVLALGLSVAYTWTSNAAKNAAKDNAGLYWFMAIAGQLVLLYFILMMIRAVDYTKDEIAAGEDMSLHFPALISFAVFGVLGYFSAYLMSLVVAVKDAASFHDRIAKGRARAWLAQKRLKATPGDIREAIKQMGVQGEPIHDAVEAAMTKEGYPEGFWFKHQASISTPIYNILFIVGSVLAWFLGGLGWGLMLPVEFAAEWNRSFYRVADELKPTTTDNKDGHTLV